MKRILALYRNAYGGLSKPAWMLALVMLINRSGTMVVPFLSIYLTDALHFSLDQAGIILSLFGLGSMTGAYLGGWLTDKIGHFRVQVMSLAFGGILFFILSWFESFESLAIGIYILSVVSESLRPANASSVAHYAKPENITRAFSLNRMAINLGFSIGPALGGLLAVLSYRLLFMADGITCLAAALFFYIYFKEKKGNEPQDKKPISSEIKSLSPYRDGLFLAFVMLCTSFAVVFFQLFMTLPLYYHDVYTLSESTIGALLALNGIVVFSLEMILVYSARVSPASLESDFHRLFAQWPFICNAESIYRLSHIDASDVCVKYLRNHGDAFYGHGGGEPFHRTKPGILYGFVCPGLFNSSCAGTLFRHKDHCAL